MRRKGRREDKFMSIPSKRLFRGEMLFILLSCVTKTVLALNFMIKIFQIGKVDWFVTPSIEGMITA